MKKANFKNINLKNIVDLSYEPNRFRINEEGKAEVYDRYSVIEKDSSRKEIRAVSI